jgi:hypothetical protein
MKDLMNSDQWQIKSSDGKGIRRKNTGTRLKEGKLYRVGDEIVGEG